MKRSVAAVACLFVMSACGDGGSGAAEVRSQGFDPSVAATVLSAFDSADSAAGAAGDVAALRGQETEPAVLFSVASARSAKANGRKQPTFRHTEPLFAIPDGATDCFVASATLRLTGEELERRDVSVFQRQPDGAWRLSHNVLLGQDTQADAVAIDPVAVPGAGAIPADRRDGLGREVFARTTGKSSPDGAPVAPAPLLDQRLAGGWKIYQQQLSGAGLTVTRDLESVDVSSCAARAGSATLLFLTLKFTDTMAAAPGRNTPALLPAKSPDGVALGLSADVRGKTVAVSRTEVFLLSVPDDKAAPSTVLGLNDTATAATAG